MNAFARRPSPSTNSPDSPTFLSPSIDPPYQLPLPFPSTVSPDCLTFLYPSVNPPYQLLLPFPTTNSPDCPTLLSPSINPPYQLHLPFPSNVFPDCQTTTLPLSNVYVVRPCPYPILPFFYHFPPLLSPSSDCPVPTSHSFIFYHTILRCVLASLKEGLSVRPSVGPSVDRRSVTLS